MKKTTLAILGSALLVASLGQTVLAAEHQDGRKAHRTPAPAAERFRNANAYFSPSVAAQRDWSRYENGAESAPAGR
jgi:hypothetical protein